VDFASPPVKGDVQEFEVKKWIKDGYFGREIRSAANVERLDTWCDPRRSSLPVPETVVVVVVEDDSEAFKLEVLQRGQTAHTVSQSCPVGRS